MPLGHPAQRPQSWMMDDHTLKGMKNTSQHLMWSRALKEPSSPCKLHTRIFIWSTTRYFTRLTAKEKRTLGRVCRGRMTLAQYRPVRQREGWLGRRCSWVGNPLPLSLLASAISLPSTARTSPACTASLAARGCSPGLAS